jgi:hypothetical protein
MYSPAYEFIKYALWPPIWDLLHLRKPREITRITAFVTGFIEGLHAPLDKATMIFVDDRAQIRSLSSWQPRRLSWPALGKSCRRPSPMRIWRVRWTSGLECVLQHGAYRRLPNRNERGGDASLTSQHDILRSDEAADLRLLRPQLRVICSAHIGPSPVRATASLGWLASPLAVPGRSAATPSPRLSRLICLGRAKGFTIYGLAQPC